MEKAIVSQSRKMGDVRGTENEMLMTETLCKLGSCAHWLSLINDGLCNAKQYLIDILTGSSEHAAVARILMLFLDSGLFTTICVSTCFLLKVANLKRDYRLSV